MSVKIRNGVYSDSLTPAPTEIHKICWNGEKPSRASKSKNVTSIQEQHNMHCDGYNIIYEQKGVNHTIDVFGMGIGFWGRSKEGVFKNFRKWVNR